jgi:NADP-reducing hydrogenase subunit HndB
MKSIKELDELREKIKQEMSAREQSHEVIITVNMGTCGIAAGARDIVKTLLEELKERGLNEVALTQTACDGIHKYEPVLEVKKGAEKTTYVNVNPDKTREIVRKHLVEGEVVKEWTTPAE